MTTLPYRRQQGTPRSGGRIAEGPQYTTERDTRSATALAERPVGRRTDRARGTLVEPAAGRSAAGRSLGATALAEPLTTGATVPATGAPATGRSAASATGRAGAPAGLRVAPPVPVSAPRAPFVALVLVLVVAGVLGILVLNTKINENAFKLQDLHDKQSTLNQQEQQLDQDLALAASPNSLAAAARRLGLVPAGTPAFIRLPDGRVLGVPQPATGAQSASGNQAGAATGGAATGGAGAQGAQPGGAGAHGARPGGAGAQGARPGGAGAHGAQPGGTAGR